MYWIIFNATKKKTDSISNDYSIIFRSNYYYYLIIYLIIPMSDSIYQVSTDVLIEPPLLKFIHY